MPQYYELGAPYKRQTKGIPTDKAETRAGGVSARCLPACGAAKSSFKGGKHKCLCKTDVAADAVADAAAAAISSSYLFFLAAAVAVDAVADAEAAATRKTIAAAICLFFGYCFHAAAERTTAAANKKRDLSVLNKFDRVGKIRARSFFGSIINIGAD